METMTFAQIMSVSYVMPVLLLLSISVMAIALERLWVVWMVERMPTHAWQRIKIRLAKRDRAGALSISQQTSGVMAEAITRMLSLQDTGTERLVETFQLYRQRMQMELSSRVGFFGTISFISPLIGLLGTVLGIIRAFHDLAAAGAGGPSVVAAGISEALITTAAGIGVAVISAVIYNYFTLTIRRRMNTADLWMFELSELLQEMPAVKL